jgi:hypothetical protein
MTNLGIIASSIQASGPTFLLDTYTGAGAAYSLRKLFSSATVAIRIIRASDSAETDIGFDGVGDLDVATISSFCSGTTGRVLILYDQSGNGYHLDVGFDAAVIYTGGSVVTINSLPAINNGNIEFSNTGVEISDLIGSSQQYVINVSVFNSGNTVFSTDDVTFSVSASPFLSYNSSSVFTIRSFPGFADDVQYVSEGLYVNSSTKPTVYLDGTLLSESFSVVGTYAPTGTQTLEIAGGASHFQELIIWPINQASNRAAIYADVSTY